MRKVVKGHRRKDGTVVKQHTRSTGSNKPGAGSEYEQRKNSFATPASSNINKVSHNPQTNTLYVGFKSGSTYAYHNVPSDVYKKFKKAAETGSAGKWHAKNVKGKFDYSKFG